MTTPKNSPIAAFLSFLPKAFLLRIASQIERIVAQDDRYVGVLQKMHWDKEGFAWIRLANSWKPSSRTLALYRDAIGKGSHPGRILILGSTPELRDLAADEFPAAQVFVADFSWKMTILMGTLCRRADLEKEMWIKADWMKLPFPEGSFDLILGDMVFLQFSPKDERAFARKVVSMLSPKGIFVTRTRVREDGASRSQAKAILERAFLDAGRAEDITGVSQRLVRALYNASPNDDTRERDAEWARQILLTADSAPSRTSLEHRVLADALERITSDEDQKSAVRFRFVDPSQEEFRGTLSEYGTIEREYLEEDAHAGESYRLVRIIPRGGSHDNA